MLEQREMSERCYVGRRRQMTVQDWLQLGWEREDAERYALLDHAAAEVVVIDANGVRPLEHHVRHSPDGFNWGYGGSGPAELARCILLDHYGLPGTAGNDWDSPTLPVSYHRFKNDVIARLDQGEAWSVSGAQIDAWANLERERDFGLER